jgi:TolB-like protein
MTVWSSETKELERLNVSLAGQSPLLEKEMELLLRTEDENVAMLYSRRCLEVIVTDLCETELNRPRKTDPLKGIIDKLNKEEKVPSYIITSMHGLNSLSTYGAHPKDFDPEQVKPALSNLAIIMKWYLSYKGIEILIKSLSAEEELITGVGKQITDTTKLEKSIAVLPFINDSPDQENTYFINGVMEEILNNLQKIRDLRVISRTSVELYRGQKKSISEIADELDVNYIVEGSGQKYGKTFCLRTQLIKAERETHLWAESFQEEIKKVTDIFNIQMQIAETIAEKLKVFITPQEKKLIEKVPTKNMAAYDAYLKGQIYWRKLTSNDLDTAMQYFNLAMEKDPESALAYAGISGVWLGRQQLGFASPEEAGEKVFEAASKALELDPSSAEVHYTLAGMHTWGMWDWDSGEAAFKRTLELNPNHSEAHAYYAHLLCILGRPEKALEHGRQSLKLDPINPLLKILYGAVIVYSARRYNEAIIIFSEVLKQEPSNVIALWGLTYSFHLTGRFNDALKNWIKAAEILHNNEITKAFNDGYSAAGYSGAMRNGAEFLVKLRESAYINPVEISFGYIMAGDIESAMEWFERAYEEHNPNVPYLVIPMLDPLRGELRFQEIAREMKLPYKFKYKRTI